MIIYEMFVLVTMPLQIILNNLVNNGSPTKRKSSFLVAFSRLHLCTGGAGPTAVPLYRDLGIASRECNSSTRCPYHLFGAGRLL